ncbi:hypothetical protein ACHAQA_005190 [Verticillium albo-atrum]
MAPSSYEEEEEEQEEERNNSSAPEEWETEEESNTSSIPEEEEQEEERNNSSAPEKWETDEQSNTSSTHEEEEQQEERNNSSPPEEQEQEQEQEQQEVESNNLPIPEEGNNLPTPEEGNNLPTPGEEEQQEEENNKSSTPDEEEEEEEESESRDAPTTSIYEEEQEEEDSDEYKEDDEEYDEEEDGYTAPRAVPRRRSARLRLRTTPTRIVTRSQPVHDVEPEVQAAPIQNFGHRALALYISPTLCPKVTLWQIKKAWREVLVVDGYIGTIRNLTEEHVILFVRRAREKTVPSLNRLVLRGLDHLEISLRHRAPESTNLSMANAAVDYMIEVAPQLSHDHRDEENRALASYGLHSAHVDRCRRIILQTDRIAMDCTPGGVFLTSTMTEFKPARGNLSEADYQALSEKVNKLLHTKRNTVYLLGYHRKEANKAQSILLADKV